MPMVSAVSTPEPVPLRLILPGKNAAYNSSGFTNTCYKKKELVNVPKQVP